VNFGVMYGMGARALAQQLGCPVPEAKQFIAEYFKTHAGVDRFLKQMVEDARTKGYTETMLGRRRALPALAGSEGLARANAERAAINTPIQGSAADLLKVAMVRLARDLEAQRIDARLLLTVHDEILLDCDAGAVEPARAAVVAAMEGAMQLSVPLEVKVGVGDNWFEVHG